MAVGRADGNPVIFFQTSLKIYYSLFTIYYSPTYGHRIDSQFLSLAATHG